MRPRIEECKRVLKETGSIFLHCDSSVSHHLRLILDDVFGPENFQSEIIWTYRRWSNAKRGLLNAHQTIYFYSKSDKFKFNMLYSDYSPTTNIDQILQERERDANGKASYKRDDKGHIVLGKERRSTFKRMGHSLSQSKSNRAYRLSNTKTYLTTRKDYRNRYRVQRNNGLDGFLKTHHLGTPVAIRIQRHSETLEEAKKQLLRAVRQRGASSKF